jgi:NADH:ubiquinone oxidoreductase subunit F (NADH-binding)
MLEILTRITEGKGEEGDIEKLEEMAHMIKETSLCGLGKTAPNPVLSTIRYFRNEYQEHIDTKKSCKRLHKKAKKKKENNA